MKSNDGYERDENTFFTIVCIGQVAGISPKDPCQELRS